MNRNISSPREVLRYLSEHRESLNPHMRTTWMYDDQQAGVANVFAGLPSNIIEAGILHNQDLFNASELVGAASLLVDRTRKVINTLRQNNIGLCAANIEGVQSRDGTRYCVLSTKLERLRNSVSASMQEALERIMDLTGRKQGANTLSEFYSAGRKPEVAEKLAQQTELIIGNIAYLICLDPSDSFEDNLQRMQTYN